MTQRREIKQRSPAVWARVKAAYLAGEPAASVARRFDVGVGNLRFRAHAEGWTRKAAMLAAEREAQAEDRRLAGEVAEPLAVPGVDEALTPAVEADPGAARRMAIARASALLAAGRAIEATALLKAAETLGRLTEGEPVSGGGGDQAAADAPEPGLSPEQEAAREATQRAQWEALHAVIEEKAEALAHKMLAGADPGHRHALFAHRWRAEALGPEVAQADHERAKRVSSRPKDWNGEGALLEADAHRDRNWDLDRAYVMAGKREEN